MADGANVQVVRRNFTFPKEYDAKIEKLMKRYGTTSKSELLRVAINRLEDETRKADEPA